MGTKHEFEKITLHTKTESDLGLWLGELARAVDDGHEAVVDVLVVQLVVETREVLLQLAHRLLAVRQHRQTVGQVAPLTRAPVNATNKRTTRVTYT